MHPVVGHPGCMLSIHPVVVLLGGWCTRLFVIRGAYILCTQPVVGHLGCMLSMHPVVGHLGRMLSMYPVASEWGYRECMLSMHPVVGHLCGWRGGERGGENERERGKRE